LRLFVAIDLDAEARGSVGAEQQRLARVLDARGSLRWVKPEQMHLTLSFLGEVDEARGAAVADAMRAPIPVAPFTMRFRGLGVFPPRGAPSVLWLGVADGSAQAIDLQRRVADRLEPLGGPREARPYHPHLTLARWRDGRPGAARRALAADGGREIARVDVRYVTLYQSRLSPHGPTYTALAQAELST